MKLTFDTRGNEAQKEAARAWADPDVTDITYGGAKGGAKSFTGCKLIFGNALMYPETYYFIARKKLNDLRKFTLPSIKECFDDWGIKLENYAKFNGQDNYFSLYNDSRVYLLETAFMPSDREYARFGSLQFTQGWGEECGEWDELADTNLQASIGRWKNDVYGLPGKYLRTCNPSKNYLYRKIYQPWKAGTLPPWRKFIQALPTDNKRLPKGYIENLERILSGNEKKRLLGGEWEYDSDPAALCNYEKILDVYTNDFLPGGRKCITSDIARLGGDRIVIIEWDGWRGKVKAYDKNLLTTTATNIEAARHRLGVGKNDVIIDADGMGVGIADFVGYRSFVNNASPLPDPLNPYDENGKPLKENFDNLKSQCYFRLADRINKNGLYLECENDEQKQLITEELEQIKQKALDSDMKKGVIPKDKVKKILGRSPDFSDTLMMRELFELQPTRTFADASY